MKKKIFKIIFILLIVVASFYGLYKYLTLVDVRLASEINKYQKIEHKEYKIEKDFTNRTYSIYKDNDDDFKILQLTDIHIGGSKASYRNDLLAFAAMYDLIKYSKPDLIVLTGDMMFSSILSRNVNNKNAAIALKVFFENIGIPWTMVFGNHDYEFYNTANPMDIATVFEASDNFLFTPYYSVANKLYSNHQINLFNEDGTLNRVLLFMDSNMLTSSDDNLTNTALSWYEITMIKNREKYGDFKSLLFLHEPLYEYSDAWDYVTMSDKYKTAGLGEYYFGSKREKICYEKKTDLFNFIKTFKSTDGVFCGHDHLNDFSVSYQGIRLTYGNSIDYITYDNIASKEEQRGGTLITIKNDASFDVNQVILKDIRRKVSD